MTPVAQFGHRAGVGPTGLLNWLTSSQMGYSKGISTGIRCLCSDNKVQPLCRNPPQPCFASICELSTLTRWALCLVVHHPSNCATSPFPGVRQAGSGFGLTCSVKTKTTPSKKKKKKEFKKKVGDCLNHCQSLPRQAH